MRSVFFIIRDVPWPQDKHYSTRLGVEIRKAAGDFEALAELVQKETVPTSGRRKLRFTMVNCITWMRM